MLNRRWFPINFLPDKITDVQNYLKYLWLYSPLPPEYKEDSCFNFCSSHMIIGKQRREELYPMERVLELDRKLSFELRICS